MNFQQLEYAIAVHQHQHFGKAAEHCNITQATLSAMIKKLEGELEFSLFDRSKHPIKTTELGIQFMLMASEALRQRTSMLSLKASDPTELEGSLTIGIIPTIANSLLPIILPAIIEENPKLELTVSEITTENIKEQLAKDQIDLGILATPLEDDSLDETILYYEPMMIYGIDNQDKNYVTSKDIQGRKVWLLEEGHCFRQQSLTICNIQEKQLHDNHLNMKANSFETLLNLTDKFGGYTLVPELYFNDLPKNRQRKTKGFQKPLPVREVSIVSHRPLAKRKSIDLLSRRVHELVTPLLSTEKMKAKDLAIIGI